MRRAEVLFLLPLVAMAQAPQRRVAITIDDLPGVAESCDLPVLQAMTARIVAPLAAQKIPATAYVIGGKCYDKLGREGLRTILKQWMDAGVELGNHTWSHPDLNRMPLADYEADLLKNEDLLKGLLGGQPLRYFRHPFLHAGKDAETKQGLEEFLKAHGYTVAPVTLDNSDWMFAYVWMDARQHGDAELARRVKEAYLPYMESIVEFFEGRSVEVVGREIPQTLLIHANQLNAEELPGLLRMLQKRGYKFVKLEEALADSVYSLPNGYAGPGGFSWIHRWSMTKGMKPKGEPDEPEFVAREYERIRNGK